MTVQFFPPEFQEEAFSCPHCGAFAEMMWRWCAHTEYERPDFGDAIQIGAEEQSLYSSQCRRCKDLALWIGEEGKTGAMIWPSSSGELPHPDMPDPIKALFDEARQIHQASPKGAAALLRLALQHLCKDLGGKGKKIDGDIELLKERGLPSSIVRTMDAMRIIGNEAVHPGEIDFDDSPEIASALFKLLNMIVEKTISERKAEEKLIASLPEGTRKKIEKRGT